MYSATRLTVIALLLAAVAGCGQMGPLYLPEAPAAETAPAVDETPATDAGETATEDSATAADAAKPDDDEG